MSLYIDFVVCHDGMGTDNLLPFYGYICRIRNSDWSSSAPLCHHKIGKEVELPAS